jgi:hypothetical protein
MWLMAKTVTKYASMSNIIAMSSRATASHTSRLDINVLQQFAMQAFR